MEFVDKVLEMHVIVQGALGSFLFWLAFIIIQKLFGLLSKFLGKYNEKIKKENILFERLHLLQYLIPIDDPKGARATLGILSFGMYKFIRGFIFLCFGLITSELIGQLAIIPYCFALYYFFRALKICTFETFSSGKTKAEKQKKYDDLREEYEKLE